MADSVVIEGDIATVRMRLSEAAGNRRNGFVELLDETPDSAHATRPEEYRKRLEAELTAEARAIFAVAEVSSLNVSVTCWRRGSLEIAALVTAGKLVVEVAELLGALQKLREVFARVTAQLVEAWISRDVQVAPATLETGDDLLLAAVQVEKTKSTAPPEGFSVVELWSNAALALLVLGATVGAVVLGVNALS